MVREPRSTRWIVALAGLLTVLAAVYLIRGFTVLVADPTAAGDLRIRWSAQQYVFLGQNPYDVQTRVWAEQEGEPVPPCPRPVEPREDLGAPGIVGEAPWSFVSGVLLFGPPWPTVRWTFAALNLLALIVIGRWAWNAGRAHGRPSAWMLCASSLALGSHATSLGVGQTGTIVLALLVLALRLEERRRPVGAGLALGVGFLKLNVAAPFALPFLVRRRWTALAAVAAYLGLTSLVVWSWIDTAPFELVRQMLWGASILEQRDSGLLAFLSGAGLGGPMTIAGLATGAVAVGLLLLRHLVDRPLLLQFAVACVVARLWTYHRVYDNSLLTFLLVALGSTWLRRPSAGLAWAYLGVGATLWTPTRFADSAALAWVHHAVWLGAVILLTRDRSSVDPWAAPSGLRVATDEPA